MKIPTLPNVYLCKNNTPHTLFQNGTQFNAKVCRSRCSFVVKCKDTSGFKDKASEICILLLLLFMCVVFFVNYIHNNYIYIYDKEKEIKYI